MKTINQKNVAPCRILAFAAGLALTGCIETTSSEYVSPEAVYQSYQVTYDASTSTLEARAQFLVGGPFGTTLSLRAPSQVMFDGKPLQETQFLGTYYTLNWRLPFSPAHSFNWIDKNGSSYRNSAELVPFKITQSQKIWKFPQPYVVTFSGPEAEGGDRFEALLDQKTTQGYQTIGLLVEIQDPTHLRISWNPEPGSSPVATSSGPATLRISRNRAVAVREATSEGGSVSARYEAPPMQIMVAR